MVSTYMCRKCGEKKSWRNLLHFGRKVVYLSQSLTGTPRQYRGAEVETERYFHPLQSGQQSGLEQQPGTFFRTYVLLLELA